MEIIIHDTRPEKDFNTTTFSNFKKSEVTKVFVETINDQNVEAALSWCTELLCSGRLKDIWDCFLLALGKHIRCGNPKLSIYLASRFDKFKEIINNGYSQLEIEVRNSPDMRKLLSEITLVLCYSPKKPSLQMLKVNKAEDYSFDKIGSNLKADNTDWCKKVLHDEDPSEIILAVNEFAYHLSKKNLLRCCYWIDWMIDFDALCRKQKKPIVVKERDVVTVEAKFMGDPIWIIWELLLIELKNDKAKTKIINCILQLFCLRYNFSQKKKRRFLIYMAVELYTENIDMTINMIHQSEKIKTIIPQISKFYKSIKKFEQRPTVTSDKQRNLMKSIDKMKLLYDY